MGRKWVMQRNWCRPQTVNFLRDCVRSTSKRKTDKMCQFRYGRFYQAYQRSLFQIFVKTIYKNFMGLWVTLYPSEIYDLSKTIHETKSGLYHFVSSLGVCISNITILLKRVKTRKGRMPSILCVILFRYKRSLCIYCYLL